MGVLDAKSNLNLRLASDMTCMKKAARGRWWQTARGGVRLDNLRVARVTGGVGSELACWRWCVVWGKMFSGAQPLAVFSEPLTDSRGVCNRRLTQNDRSLEEVRSERSKKFGGRGKELNNVREICSETVDEATGL